MAAAVAARSLLAAGRARAGGRRCRARALPAAGAAPYCTVAPQQQQRRQPPPDMKSYLWSRYKEAKRVTKGERRAGARGPRAAAAAGLPWPCQPSSCCRSERRPPQKANRRPLAVGRGGTANRAGAGAAA